MRAVPNVHKVFVCDPWMELIQRLITGDSWEMEDVEFFRLLWCVWQAARAGRGTRQGGASENNAENGNAKSEREEVEG